MSDERDPLAIGEYEPNSSVALTDDERWPGITPQHRRALDAVLQHPLAPQWVHRTGHRLDAEGVARAMAPLPTDDWLAQHLATAAALPAYRNHAGPLDRLEHFPLLARSDLAARIADFVPYDADLSRLVAGTSSGVTGNALVIPDDVDDVARTFWMLHRLLQSAGVQWQADPDRLALAYVVKQRQVFTYASSVPGFDGGVMARINLGERQWADRDGFLRALDPQVYSGSPASLAELLAPELRPHLHPLALVSGATHLSAALRRELEQAFACPVIDLYGLHETRPIAASIDGGPFVVLDTRVHVECVDASGVPVAPGERGELVVTVGANPLLPLVRYRTGDFGRLATVGSRVAIADLEGREDVAFTGRDGATVPSVDLTQQLQASGALGWTVVQHSDASVTATIVGGDQDFVESRLGQLFERVTLRPAASLDDLGEGKPRRYRRE
jgi:phenylacetate-CoA ligase